MKSIKTMLLGIATLVMTMIAIVVDGRSGSWLGGASVILLITGAVIFLVGIFMKTDKQQQKNPMEWGSPQPSDFSLN